MTNAIQEAYYLRAINPPDNSTLINLAVELGLNDDLAPIAVDYRSHQSALAAITAALQA